MIDEHAWAGYLTRIAAAGGEIPYPTDPVASWQAHEQLEATDFPEHGAMPAREPQASSSSR